MEGADESTELQRHPLILPYLKMCNLPQMDDLIFRSAKMVVDYT